MTLTQNKSIALQYAAGVRAFDLRVARAADGTIWCCHTFATISLAEFIQVVKDKEDVVVLVRPDYNSGNTLANYDQQVVDMLQEIKGVTYYLQYLEVFLPAAGRVRSFNDLNIVWFDSQTAADFEADYKAYKFDGTRDVLSAALTPSTKVTFKNLFCITLGNYAAKLAPFIDQVVKKEQKPYIAMIDFV